ncbi:MAG: alpha/beta hydrolase [Litorimonas sp.]
MRLFATFVLSLFMTGPAFAQDKILPLWIDGAPGFEDRKDIPERAKDWWVRDIHNPSLTLFYPGSPNQEAMGTAIIVVPGGGHKDLVFNSEGSKAAKFLSEQNITAFALKYRLARQPGSDYDIETHAAEDLRRAIRYVRANAALYNLDTNKIGVMGFSAGGELVNLVTYGETDGDKESNDRVERVSARPDFQIQIYPGPIGLPDHLKQSPPPAFFLSAFDDAGPELTISRHLDMYRAAGVAAEVHIFAQGGHAFNMGDRSDLETISKWPDRLKDWLDDSGYSGQP